MFNLVATSHTCTLGLVLQCSCHHSQCSCSHW